MAEEVKDEKVEETSEEKPEETSDGSSVEESSSEVTTEPTVEGDNQSLDLVQLEQRITSLEQRLLSVETPQPTSDGSDPNGEPEVAEETTGQDGDSRDDEVESTDDIKKILDL
ncbi:hypothetical protein [Staphylococcus phage PT1-9]